MNDLAKAITAPTKLVFVGFVVLAALGKFERKDCWAGFDWPDLAAFITVSALFLAVQIYHDDYLRPLLNTRAQIRGEAERCTAFRAGYLDAGRTVWEEKKRRGWPSKWGQLQEPDGERSEFTGSTLGKGNS